MSHYVCFSSSNHLLFYCFMNLSFIHLKFNYDFIFYSSVINLKCSYQKYVHLHCKCIFINFKDSTLFTYKNKNNIKCIYICLLKHFNQFQNQNKKFLFMPISLIFLKYIRTNQQYIFTDWYLILLYFRFSFYFFNHHHSFQLTYISLLRKLINFFYLIYFFD